MQFPGDRQTIGISKRMPKIHDPAHQLQACAGRMSIVRRIVSLSNCSISLWPINLQANHSSTLKVLITFGKIDDNFPKK
jgi:hypothetical protein